jgi:hypothetical protein
VPPATQQGASTVNAFQEEQKPLTNHQLTALQSVHSAQDLQVSSIYHHIVSHNTKALLQLQEIKSCTQHVASCPLQGVSQALATFNSTGSHERGADLAHPELSIAIEARLSEQVLQSAPPSVLASLFTQAAQAGVMFTDNWKAAALRIADTAMQRLSTSSASEARVLTQLLWGVSELGCDPQESWLQAAAYKVSACAQEASLLACDLSTCLAALGAMGYKPDPTWASAMVEEVSYQLAEFQSDLEAGDVARLVSGLADLKLGSQLSAEGNRLLMKAVYGKVRPQSGCCGWYVVYPPAMDCSVAIGCCGTLHDVHHLACLLWSAPWKMHRSSRGIQQYVAGIDVCQWLLTVMTGTNH